jgi:hypothetical protein
VADDYHTFTIEWQPDLIEWYVDGILYHTAVPADVPGPWVFNDPVYLLMNLSVGGNFGGPVAATTTFPQEMKVDYVRVYQAPDTAERFKATFVDAAPGWNQITIPFADFVRSADQPAGAPDDGLTLSDVWGYGFAVPCGATAGTLTVDQVRISTVDGASASAAEGLLVSDPGTVGPRRHTLAAFPNPFSSATRLEFSLEAAGPVDVFIHDLQGRRLRVLVQKSLPAGTHSTRWDGRDDQGRAVPAGIYFAMIRQGGRSEVRKLVLRP